MKKNSLPKMRLTTSVLASLLACVVTSAHAEQVTSYQYNDMGLLIGMDGPRTDVDDSTHFAYDAQGHISSLTNALGQQWQYLDYNATGNPTRIIDANGVETSLSYSDGHITALSRAGLTWQYAYDDLGQLISSTDPAGLITSRTYDDARRLTSITYPDGSVLAFTLDAAGNVTQQNLTQADGTIVSLHRFAYDELSQLLSSATEQSQQQYEYDLTGNKMAVIDGKGQQIKLQYDALNRLVGDVDRLGNTTKYAYNPQNQLVSLTDTNGGTTQYQYNNLGQLIVQQSPDTGRTTYQHDEADNLISITDARDLTVTQEFDALNRLVNRKLNNGESITYGYDEVQHGASMGKLTSLTRSGSKLSFSYLDNGLLGQFDRDYTVGGISNSFSQQFSYDSAGRLQSIQYGNEVTISYSFGADGHIDQITFSAPGATQGVAASNIRLRPDDQLSDLTLGNGLSLHREFNSGGELVSQQWGNEQTSYSYDANGNLIAHEDDSYSFDTMDRLVSMSGSHQQTYQFDNVGNRLLQLLDGQRRQYTYEPNSNRMSRINRKKVSLDVSGYLSGNPLSAAQTYQWNELGELKALWQAGKVKAKYQYNGLSQRTSKSVGNYNTLFDYTPQGHLAHVAYYNGQKLAWNRYYIWLGEQPLVQLEVKYVGKKATPTLNSLVYLQTDHLNAPYAATDSQGKTVWRWSHDPFGVGKADRNPDGDKIAIDVPLRFPGQLEDTETGLFYNWHRYYDPSTGRYISSDPLGLAAGVNTYGYVGGNPLGYVDESGLNTNDINQQHELEDEYQETAGGGSFIDIDHDGKNDIVNIIPTGPVPGVGLLSARPAGIPVAGGRSCTTNEGIGTITTRVTNTTTRLGGKPGEPGVKITYKDGTEFDMTRSRVKETEINPYQPGRTRPKHFEDGLDKKGTKRAPTQDELNWFNNIDW